MVLMEIHTSCSLSVYICAAHWVEKPNNNIKTQNTLWKHVFLPVNLLLLQHEIILKLSDVVFLQWQQAYWNQFLMIRNNTEVSLPVPSPQK